MSDKEITIEEKNPKRDKKVKDKRKRPKKKIDVGKKKNIIRINIDDRGKPPLDMLKTRNRVKGVA